MPVEVVNVTRPIFRSPVCAFSLHNAFLDLEENENPFIVVDWQLANVSVIIILKFTHLLRFLRINLTTWIRNRPNRVKRKSLLEGIKIFCDESASGATSHTANLPVLSTNLGRNWRGEEKGGKTILGRVLKC